ncbi:pectate lyase [Flavobacteriaceae bacterium GF1]
MRNILPIIMLFFLCLAKAQTTIVLSTKKAFPGAFGPAEVATGGHENTPNYVGVTNTNNSGTGSLRGSISDNTVLIPTVNGVISPSSILSSSGIENFTYWGQFAPIGGLRVSGESVRFQDCTNLIIRYLTTEFGSTGIAPLRIEEADAWSHPVGEDNHAIYLDHISARYSEDQVTDAITRHSTDKVTISNSIFAESATGGIIGDSGSAAADTGESTYARNFAYNVSHRFPNVSGSIHDHQNFNNYQTNWSSRLIRSNGGVLIDVYHNYSELGNITQTSSIPVHKLGNPRTNARVYAGFNFVGGVDEAPTDNQTGIVVYYNNNGAELDNAPVDASYYVSSKQHSFSEPLNGVLNFSEVKAEITKYSGNIRGINADGSPGYYRDNKDQEYIDKSLTSTSESSYRDAASWDAATAPASVSYADTDGDFMPDWFENQHAHLDPNSSADRDTVHVNWTFSAYTVTNSQGQGNWYINAYNVTNNAGYTNLEMAAAFYAGDFDLQATTGRVIKRPTINGGKVKIKEN